MISVVVVDDVDIARAGVAALLTTDPEIDVVQVADTPATALQVIAEVSPDVAVVGCGPPGSNGVELCERIAHGHPGVAVVVMSEASDAATVDAALNAGARACVERDVGGGDLTRLVRAVASGDRVVPWRGDGDGDGRRRPARRRAELSDRELAVLRLVATGATNKQIAATLGVSENTIRTYVRRILAKLDCGSRAEASARAAERGLL